MTPLTWTNDPPAAEGWYWWRKRPGKVPIITYVKPSEAEGDTRMIREDRDEFVPSGTLAPSGQWAGPIAEPEETTP